MCFYRWFWILTDMRLLGDTTEPVFMARRPEASGNRDFRLLRKLAVIRGLEDMLSRAIPLDEFL